MSQVLQKKVLVLNKTWAPMGVVTLQRAIVMLFSEYSDGTPKAKVIEPESYAQMTWSDWSKLRPLATDEVLQTASLSFRIPEIILLSRYEKLPKPKYHFSRRTLYKRDNLQCQYCGKKFNSSELTVDHVLARSKGGLTTWENCVCACVPCNSRKGSRTLQECGMKLIRQPKKPKLSLFKFDTVKPLDSWKSLVDAAYWNVELENDNKT